METVTYVIDGRIDHYDNYGNQGSLLPGNVQWMTAGRGIVHNEQPAAGVTVHSLQLWVNLPAADKMVEPRTQNLVAADLPLRREPGAEIRVFSGQSGDVIAPTKNYTPDAALRKHVPHSVDELVDERKKFLCRRAGFAHAQI
jgi:redox-sensitive bicupin YhaK (pirin superfamily)